MENIFFLNPDLGWAVSIREGPPPRGMLLRLAATTNGGASWRIRPILRDGPSLGLTVEVVGLDFLDSLHGWIDVNTGTMNFLGGPLFATTDGGLTWKRLPPPPDRGDIRFIDPSHGWLVGWGGTETGRKLFATTDGGRSWQRQSFPQPSLSGTLERVALDPPVFRNPRDGLLAVAFTTQVGPRQHQSVIAEYGTSNGGSSWSLLRALPAVESKGYTPPPLIVGTDLIWGYTDASHIAVAHGTVGAASHREGPLVLDGLQFADGEHGWLLLAGGACKGFKCDCYQDTDLLATSDGGATLRQTHPPVGRPPVISPCSSTPQKLPRRGQFANRQSSIRQFCYNPPLPKH